MSTMIKVDKPRRRDRGFIDPNLLPAMKRVNPPFFYAHYENGWELTLSMDSSPPCADMQRCPV